MRCKSCDKLMEDFELSKDDKIRGVPADMCSGCLYVSNLALLGLDSEEAGYIDDTDLDHIVLRDEHVEY